MGGKRPEDRVPVDLAAVVHAQDHRFHVIVEDLARHPAQGGKGRFVQAQQGGQRLIEGHVGEHGPAVAQGADEPGQAAFLAVRLDEGAQLAPIDLRLLAGRGFEAADGDTLGGLPPRLQVVLQGGVAARVALGAQLAQQDAGVPDPRLQPLLDKRLIGGQPGRPGRPQRVAGGRRVGEILPNGTPVEAGLGGDLADRQPLAFQFLDLVHVSSS